MQAEMPPLVLRTNSAQMAKAVFLFRREKILVAALHKKWQRKGNDDEVLAADCQWQSAGDRRNQESP